MSHLSRDALCQQKAVRLPGLHICMEVFMPQLLVTSHPPGGGRACAASHLQSQGGQREEALPHPQGPQEDTPTQLPHLLILQKTLKRPRFEGEISQFLNAGKSQNLGLRKGAVSQHFVKRELKLQSARFLFAIPQPQVIIRLKYR